MPPMSRFAMLLVLPALCAVLAACQQHSPLDGDQPRTPYTQYQELRQKDPALNTEDATGETRPNLRGRLLR